MHGFCELFFEYFCGCFNRKMLSLLEKLSILQRLPIYYLLAM
jgi:hypothetical protein